VAAAWSQTTKAPPTETDQKEAQTKAELLGNRGFAKCGSGNSYYSGPFIIDKKMGLGCIGHADGSSGHDCQMVLEMDTDTTDPTPFAAKPDMPLRDGYQWAITFDASKTRDRYKLDGIWQAWGRPRNQQNLVIIAVLFKRSGEWFASDMRMSGPEASLAGSFPPTIGSMLGVYTRAVGNLGEMQGILRPTPFDELLGTITKPSCTDIQSATVPIRSSAPGHSLRDTYARTIEIAKENASNGIPDALNAPISPIKGLRTLDVCYSITHAAKDPPKVYRQCEKTGEVVRVPGDLDVPPGFWASYRQRCDQSPALEVALKGAGRNDGRKRFIDCTDAMFLAATRKSLLAVGVGD
jgi:hypothetical protein